MTDETITVSPSFATRYQRVNGTWPKGELPKMTGAEAIRAAKRLYWLVMEKRWPGTWKAGRGNHRSYPRGSVFLVNPGQGWHDMVHDLSHACWRRMKPGVRPHAAGHAYIERLMIEQVVTQGWLDGRLKAKEKPKVNVKAKRYASIVKRLAQWERRKKRAETAIKKLKRQAVGYQRRGVSIG